MQTSSNDPPFTPKHRLRWYQYSLRSLFLLMIVVAIASSWLAVKMKEASKQRESVEALQQLECVIRYNYEVDAAGNDLTQGTSALEPPAPKWLRKLLGDDFFTSVYSVNLFAVKLSDVREHLHHFKHLHGLCIYNRRITDADIEQLKDLKELKELFIHTQPDRSQFDKLQKALPHVKIEEVDILVE